MALGPRAPGSEGAAAARAYLGAELRRLGLAPSEHGEIARNVVAEIPGESSDLLVLMAPYDSQGFEEFRFVGANDGASGAAMLIELARLLALKPLPFTVQLAFTGADHQIGDEVLQGSEQRVLALEEEGRLGDVRLAVYWNQVADLDLTITRDLRSSRFYRDTFFRAARRLGYPREFPTAQPYGSPMGGHLAFRLAGMRDVVALIDDRFGGDESPGVFAHTEEDDLAHCSAASLEAVLAVSEAGLRDIANLLAKLDERSRREEK